jgi:hypothetical protein
MISQIAGIVLLAASLWIIALNWYSLVQRCRKRAMASWIPFLGAAAACLGLLVAGADLPWWGWLVPWVIDFGALPGMSWCVVVWIRACRPGCERDGQGGDQE